MLALVDDLCALGPMGFRGPAAEVVPDHMASEDAGMRTAQLIAPGYECPANALVDEVLARIGGEFLFVTSANRSSPPTGKVEPAHYTMAGIRGDFGGEPGVVLIGFPDEAAVRARYPRHLPMSTSILAFHRLVEDEGKRPALVLERHGSLDVGDVRDVVERHGFGLAIGAAAGARLPVRS